MVKILSLFRVKHYIKNFLIFLPIFFARDIANVDGLFTLLVGFIAFSLSSSLVYIINDIHDVELDRKHPIKKNRPIASNQISIRNALLLSVILGIIVLLICSIWKFNMLSISLLALYILTNYLYSTKLKTYPLIDVSIIASGFVLRVLFGGALVNIPISNWLILTILAFSLFMAFGKRRNELIKNGSESRAVLSVYKHEFLDKSMYVSETLFIVFYSLWSLSGNMFAQQSNWLIWTVPLVVLIVFRYSMIIESDSYGDPADILFSDKTLGTLVVAYGIFMMSLYLLG